MFTGIIEGLGTISDVRSGQGKQLTVEADFDLNGTKIGDSIAVNGACLTVVELYSRRFKVDVSPETIEKTTFNRIKTGDSVNLERALRLSDRIDGHLVSGHIDGTGIVRHREITGNAIIVTVGVHESLSRYMIPKGSVAVDGVSLTINEWSRGSFSVSIIPHTARLTTVGFKNIGDAVTIETHMIGKYVERFTTERKQSKTSPLDMEFLLKTGFI